MIVLRAVRVEDTGAETELGELRLLETGVVYSHMSTAEGAGVMRDLRERLRDTDPAVVAAKNAGRPLTAESPYDASRAPLVPVPRPARAHQDLASPYDLNALARERAARRGW